jgi:hypothetical protein
MPIRKWKYVPVSAQRFQQCRIWVRRLGAWLRYTDRDCFVRLQDESRMRRYHLRELRELREAAEVVAVDATADFYLSP